MNLPYMDSWALVPLLDARAAGQLSLGALWAQHNEHRIVLPRLVMLALARTEVWDARIEMAASLVFAAGSTVLLSRLVSRTVRPLAPRLVPWLVIATGWLVFSMSQYENWIWGWQLQIVMTAFFTAAFASSLGRYGASWRGLAGMAAAAAAGTLSFSSGLMLFALLPVAMVLGADDSTPRRRAPRIALAAVLAAAAYAAYLTDFVYPPQHPIPFLALRQPLAYAEYVVAYVGGAMGGIDALGSSLLWGSGGIAVVVAAAVWYGRGPAVVRMALAPWLVLALYGIGSGCLTGIGRLGFGVTQALSPRYATITTPLWLSVLVMGSLAAARLLDRSGPSFARTLLAGIVAVVVIALGVGAQRTAWAQGRRFFKTHRAVLRRARPCVLDYAHAPDDCLGLLFSDPSYLRVQAERLDRLGLLRAFDVAEKRRAQAAGTIDITDRVRH